MKKRFFKIVSIALSILAIVVFTGCDQATDGTTGSTTGSSSTSSADTTIASVLAEVGISVPSGYTEYRISYDGEDWSKNDSIFLSPDNSEYIKVYWLSENGEVMMKIVSVVSLIKVESGIAPTVYLKASDSEEASSTPLENYEQYMYEEKFSAFHSWYAPSWDGNSTWVSSLPSNTYIFMNMQGDQLVLLGLYSPETDDTDVFCTGYSSQDDFNSHMTMTFGWYTKQ